MTHSADPALAATVRQARAQSWGASRPLRTHYPGPNALRQASAGRLVMESVRAENSSMPDDHAGSRRHHVADELERRGLSESAAAARWEWKAADAERARRESEEAQRQSRRPAQEDPIGSVVATGLITAAALAATGDALLVDCVDSTVHGATGDSGSDRALDGELVTGLSTSQFAADLGSVELGPLPVADVAPGVALGDQVAAAEPTTGSSGTLTHEVAPSVEVGGGPDLG